MSYLCSTHKTGKIVASFNHFNTFAVSKLYTGLRCGINKQNYCAIFRGLDSEKYSNNLLWGIEYDYKI